MAKLSADLKREIDNTQSMVLKAVRNQVEVKPRALANSLFDEVGKQTEEDLVTKIGAVGKTLKNYSNQIAFDHIDWAQENWSDFSRDVLQALAQPSEESKTKLNNVYKPVIREMTAPKPRFVKDPLRRNDARKEKKQAKHIGLKQVYMLGENGFYGKPQSFDPFVRNNKDHLGEISILEQQHELFTKHGMLEVAHSVKKRIKGLDEMRESAHLGFHRLKPSDAAMIAARMIGLKWHELHFLTVPFKFFEELYWPEQPAEKEDKAKEEMKRLLVMKDKRSAAVDSVSFGYQPRLYPLDKFTEMPKLVVEIITSVESFKDLGGHPVFDYYWLLVPSININHPYFRHKDGWKVCTRKKDEARPYSGYVFHQQSYSDEYEAALALDTALIADGYFVPIVLGEREGKCHFLCMWQ